MAYQGALDAASLTGKRPGLQGRSTMPSRVRSCACEHRKAWNPVVGAWADANLNRFADEMAAPLRGYLPVKDDTDVTEDDVRHANLILFGDPGSNRWISESCPSSDPLDA